MPPGAILLQLNAGSSLAAIMALIPLPPPPEAPPVEGEDEDEAGMCDRLKCPWLELEYGDEVGEEVVGEENEEEREEEEVIAQGWEILLGTF